MKKKKKSLCQVWNNFNNIDNCKFFNAKVTLFELLYYISSLFGRYIQVRLAEFKTCNNLEILDNQSFPIQVVIKIMAKDIKTILNKIEIFIKVANNN